MVLHHLWDRKPVHKTTSIEVVCTKTRQPSCLFLVSIRMLFWETQELALGSSIFVEVRWSASTIPKLKDSARWTAAAMAIAINLRSPRMILMTRLLLNKANLLFCSMRLNRLWKNSYLLPTRRKFVRMAKSLSSVRKPKSPVNWTKFSLLWE